MGMVRTKSRKKVSAPLLNQLGQATTEYVLLISIVVSFFVLISKSLLLPKIQQLQGKLKGTIESMYSGENLHRLIFKVPK